MTVRLTRRSFLGVSASAGLALRGGLALCGVSLARAGDLALPAAAAGEAASASASASAVASAPPAGVPRIIELFNTHTTESLKVAYRCATGFVPDALARLQWLLRDHRANESAPMDPVLFDQLATLAATAGVAPHYEIISGYRSPTTNARLAGAGRGVAKRSLHMEGRAIDVRLRGLSCDQLRDLALAAARGGVGYYQKSDFVHLDTGRVRTWAG